MRPLRHWFAELILVFIGAYAAFWLNSYQERREERQRHDQIITALQEEIRGAIDNARKGAAEQAKVAEEFRRALKAGEMPPLGLFSFVSDYSATDVATLLQSGGFQLLNVKTIMALRKMENVLRGGGSELNHFQKLSDELIVPNLDQDITFFYDPATKKLRKRFARYPDALDMVVKFLNDYADAATEVINQLQAERQRR